MAATAALSPKPVLPPIGASRSSATANELASEHENAPPATRSPISALSAASDFVSNPFEYSRTVADMLDELHKERDNSARAALCMAHINAGLCELIESTWEALSMQNPRQWTKLDTKQDAAVNNWKNLALIAVIATTEGEGAALSKVLDSGAVKFAIEVLCTDLFHPSSYSKHQPRIACLLMTIVYNVVRRWVVGLEKIRAIKDECRVLSKYVASGNPNLKTLAIMLLACTLSESEQKNAPGQLDSHIRHMVQVLDDCVKSRRKDHFSDEYGYPAYEVMKGLRRLAASDVNKDKAVAYGALVPYSKVVKENSFSDDEKKEACKALWSFAFSSSNRSKISAQKDCIEGLHQISENCEGALKSAADGVLWIIEREAQHIKKASRISPITIGAKEKGNEVVLSVHRSALKQAEGLKDRLVEAGYSAKLLDDRSLPYSPDEVATVIDGATVVLALYTESYKLSSACRLEAQYAKKRAKSLIALKVERAYSPDGWLNALLEDRMSLDLSDTESQHEVFQDLSEEIRIILQGANTDGKSNQEQASTAVSPALLRRDVSRYSAASASLLQASTSQSPQRQKTGDYAALKANSWNEEQVRGWLEDGQLSKHIDRFPKYAGSHVVALRRLMDTAPEFFYNSMKQQYSFDMHEILTFSNMLQSLV